MIPLSFPCLVICFGIFFSSLAAQTVTVDVGLKGKYRGIEVAKLDVALDVDIPTNQINVVFLEIVDELNKIKKFDRITKLGSNPNARSANSMPTIRLEGTIAKYFALVPQKYTTEGGDIGSHLKLTIKFMDAADGKLLFEKEIDRRIFFGAYQFTLDDVGRKVAKEVAKITKKTFF